MGKRSSLEQPLAGDYASMDSDVEGGSGSLSALVEGSIADAPVIKNELGTFMGVYVPCCLSIFGIILFLKLSNVVGEAGLWWSYFLVFFGEAIAILTVLSICACSTNGRMKGGGSYFMISRALGPEFGGAIGLIFYLANIFATALYLKALAADIRETIPVMIIPNSEYMSDVVMSTIALFFVIAICYIGAEAYSKTALLIFAILVLSIVSGLLSLLFQSPGVTEGYTGIRSETLSQNLQADYTGSNTLWVMFGVFFNAVTGLNAGANMSGDLKDPGRSIPRGTLAAMGTSLVTYLIFVTVFASSIERPILQDPNKSLTIMQNVCFHPALVYVGIFISLFAGSLASVIGASRIMQALARDRLLAPLNMFAKGSAKGDEPRRAVFLSYCLVQMFLFIGSLNQVAALTTLMFLVSYATTNLACFVLEVSGAPNFRPMFKYFSWHTALSGGLACVIAMFLIDPAYAAGAFFFFLVVFVSIHYTAPPQSWGDISQALIYHQVRKYLLRLDERKQHVKFWRPGVLLVVDDPTRSHSLINVANNMKKGGLFILASAHEGDIRQVGSAVAEERNHWMDYIRTTKIKAFYDVAVASSRRSAIQNLLMTCGLGSMRPNIIIYDLPSYFSSVGLQDAAYSSGSSGEDTVEGEPLRRVTERSQRSRSIHELARRVQGGKIPAELMQVRATRAKLGGKNFASEEEFVALLDDALALDKSVLVSRGFENLNRELIVQYTLENIVSSMLGLRKAPSKKMNLDIWIFSERETFLTNGDWDCSLVGGNVTFALQLGCILHMTDIWKEHTNLRVITFVETHQEVERVYRRFEELLLLIRIRAKIVVLALEGSELRTLRDTTGVPFSSLETATQAEVANELIARQSGQSALSFITVDAPGDHGRDAERFVADLEILSRGIPPTFMVHGRSVVTTSEL